MRRQSKSNELTELLKYQITSGKLKAGDQLEAIVKLAKRHNTTIVTVSKAQKIVFFGTNHRPKYIYIRFETQIGPNYVVHISSQIVFLECEYY